MKIQQREREMEISHSEVKVKWVYPTSILMAGIDSRGASAVIGMLADEEPQVTGLKASDLLLMSAASCSAYDVVMILKKRKEPLESLDVTCSGQMESEPVRRFTKLHLKYIVKGQVKPESVEKAIKLSEDKYCSVLNTLRGSVEISSEFEIID